jgi:putative SOS response-associated peptidase YedK
MCGRYTLTQTGQLPAVFEISEIRIPPRFNIAPTQEVPVVRLSDEKGRYLDSLKWGLVPRWSKDPSLGARMINARSETVEKKPSFREAFRQRRCLVPADGFYEWKKSPGSKQPYFIGMSDRSVFAFAGLWEYFSKDGRELETFTILTCKPNNLLSEIHDRMPVILPRESFSSWLDPRRDSSSLKSLLAPYSAEEMTAYRVSRLVNNPRNDVPECVEPVDRLPSLFGS